MSLYSRNKIMEREQQAHAQCVDQPVTKVKLFWVVFWVQVQRWWVNFDGVATAKHFALQVAAMEELRKRNT